MNVFNRVVVILLLLVLIPIVTAGLIVPSESIDLLREGLDLLEERLDLSVSARRLVISGGVALFVDLLLVFLLYLELRRPTVRAVSVQKVEGGEAKIAINSIVDRLAYHIDRLSGVLEVEPEVTPHRRGVEVALEVEAVADVDVPATIEEISAIVRRVIEEEMGLKLRGKPQINLQTVSFPPATPYEEARPTLPPAAREGRDEPEREVTASASSSDEGGATGVE